MKVHICGRCKMGIEGEAFYFDETGNISFCSFCNPIIAEWIRLQDLGENHIKFNFCGACGALKSIELADGPIPRGRPPKIRYANK